jgi:hypothetical protein
MDYVFDVTDMAPLLRDSVTVNSSLGVGSPGFGIYTKLIFIEGTPDRNAIAVKRIYAHGGAYGNASNPIDNNFPVVNQTAPVGTVSTAFRFIVTGHGNDANGCCEFADHYYDLFLNSSAITRRHIWRNDCGVNETYPQGGTWVFERANWCPGASVKPYYDVLPAITAGSNYNVNLSFEPYTVASVSGNYFATASVVYYGGINKTLDASIDDIISPSSHPDHFRENPSSSKPTIRLHNSGSTPIDSVAFLYGVDDTAMEPYVWAGTLAPLADTVITLPPSAALTYLSASSQSGSFPFKVLVTAVNGTADADQTNDTMRSRFVIAPNWPDTIMIKMLTSNLATDGMNLNANPSDASWYVTNINGDTISSRTNTNYSTLYMDTLILPGNGFYKFTISSPGYCGGLHWWLFDQALTGYVPGYLQIKRMTGANLPMHGYTYATNTSPGGLKNFGEHDDYGCSYSQYFYVGTADELGVRNISIAPTVAVYPNPADGEINVEFDNIDVANSSVSVVNILGQKVYSGKVTTGKMTINSSAFAPGLYTILYTTASGSGTAGKVIVSH